MISKNLNVIETNQELQEVLKERKTFGIKFDSVPNGSSLDIEIRFIKEEIGLDKSIKKSIGFRGTDPDQAQQAIHNLFFIWAVKIKRGRFNLESIDEGLKRIGI